MGSGTDLPIYVIVGFPNSARLNNQQPNTDSLYRPSVSFAQCVIGTEKCPSAGKNLNYREDKNSQGYSEDVSCFKD